MRRRVVNAGGGGHCEGKSLVSKLVMAVLCVSLCGVGCGDDDGAPPGGTGGASGSGGIGGDQDAEVLTDAGIDAVVPSQFGELSLNLNDLSGMEGKQVIVEVLAAPTQATVGGACVQVTSDPFSVLVPLTLRISTALCDYGTDTQLPVGDYVITVQVQEPEVFPAILCAQTTATVSIGETTTATIDGYRACVGGFADGAYEAGPISCATASAPIAHTSTDAAASLMDFTDTTLTAERNGMEWLETYEDVDCHMELMREIVLDDVNGGFLRFSTERSYVWEPSDCTFTVTAGGDTAEIGAGFAYYQPTDDVRVDDVWFYTPSGNGFRVAGAPAIWNQLTPALDLPCDPSEALARAWMRR